MNPIDKLAIIGDLAANESASCCRQKAYTGLERESWPYDILTKRAVRLLGGNRVGVKAKPFEPMVFEHCGEAATDDAALQNHPVLLANSLTMEMLPRHHSDQPICDSVLFSMLEKAKIYVAAASSTRVHVTSKPAPTRISSTVTRPIC